MVSDDWDKLAVEDVHVDPIGGSVDDRGRGDEISMIWAANSDGAILSVLESSHLSMLTVSSSPFSFSPRCCRWRLLLLLLLLVLFEAFAQAVQLWYAFSYFFVFCCALLIWFNRFQTLHRRPTPLRRFGKFQPPRSRKWRIPMPGVWILGHVTSQFVTSACICSQNLDRVAPPAMTMVSIFVPFFAWYLPPL